jgi:hypothetical protein
MTAPVKATPDKDSPIVIPFHGESYKIPPGDDWDLTVLDLLFEGNLSGSIKALLGDTQYTKFRAKHHTVGLAREFVALASEKANLGN